MERVSGFMEKESEFMEKVVAAVGLLTHVVVMIYWTRTEGNAEAEPIA